ncbi:hypothetical protein F5J12DRAFT_876598 [Pisolithus orientalis]|uniref:uncharacterized protein n=1 Tax=Pisolithus orientalis TaxID=936130 RepID=UPI0022242839|nr:uncharacterized protein F5J12DRAFT_876598 [Pisolithus orientalis]KAI5982396.1 hypothetical protein F5J12DRAFT_876598 [Pisolithus orientalis]
MVSRSTEARSAAELELATMWDTSEAQSTAELSARAANTSVDGHGPCSLQSCKGVLPFPTRQFSCNRQPEVEHININVMTAKELKVLCRKLGLSQTGTKQVLLERLEAFSQDHDAWQRVLPGARRSHKGPQNHHAQDTGSGKGKRGPAKRSAKRRALLLGGSSSDAAVPSATERSKDTQTQAEKAAVLDWARTTLTLYPYQPPPAVAVTTGHGGGPLGAPSGMSLARAPASQSPGLPSPSADARCPSLASGDTSPTVMATDPSSVVRMLTLGDGTVLAFTLADIGDPTAVGFSKDIPRLNSMWDDTSPHWTGQSTLTIKGRPIAIKYWPEVYRYAHNRQWKGIKHNWTCWKYIVECYCQGTPDEFWRRFSENGRPMSYTRILVLLHEARKKEDQEAVWKAAEEFGESFDTQCTYRKGSNIHVLTQPRAIAKRLHRLSDGHGRDEGGSI